MDDLENDPPPTSVSRQPLDDVQLDLLEAVWDPVSHELSGWPVADYVSRRLYQGRHTVTDLESIYRSLPTVMVRGIQYGLVWRTGSAGSADSHDTVGLTIAGMVQLAQRRQPLRQFADGLAQIIGFLAAQEHNITPDPNRVVEPDFPLANLLESLHSRSRDFITSVPIASLGELLTREAAPLYIRNDSQVGWTATLKVWLRPYLDVTDAIGYLARVEEQATPPQPAASPAPPQWLPQMLDYLSYVLDGHPGWNGGRLVSVPNMQAAASLVLDAGTSEEFRARMSDLAQVLENLRVEALPDDVVAAEFDGKQPKSLTRLKFWLDQHLVGDDSKSRAKAAMADVGSTLALRNVGQHSNRNAEKAARNARSRLGVPDVIWNWASAWGTIRSRLIEALDVIRQEVQLSQESAVN